MVENLLFWLFWGSAAVVAYTYVAFPGLVFLRGRWRRAPYRVADITPAVSLIIAAHNEADSIGRKLDNVLALDYPADRRQVVVASDGSTDGTNEIVARYADRGVTLLARPREGKAPALNAAVAEASGEILVFSDANSMFAADALRGLVRPFADPGVGGVAGNQCYLEAHRASSGAGEQGYWSFDRRLKTSQSRAGHAISATGAIYAIRRSLFGPVPGGVTDDFYTSVGVIAAGFRLVFAPDAVAYEPVADTGQREFGRKVRIMTRGLRAVLLRRELLNPWRHGFYAVQLFSHKVLRRVVAFPLIILMVVSPLLWTAGPIYRAAALLQAGFYGLALLGWLSGSAGLARSKALTIPFYFGMVNAAALVATLKVLSGQKIERWEPQRASAEPAPEPRADTALTSSPRS